jgi:hypothetical protein
LFTTEDGLAYSGEPIQLWYIKPNSWNPIEIYAPNWWCEETRETSRDAASVLPRPIKLTNKWFSTKLAAETYILENKPILSLNDILSAWDANADQLKAQYKSSTMYKNFERLAKQKLNQ